jgi:hypothetical protein
LLSVGAAKVTDSQKATQEILELLETAEGVYQDDLGFLHTALEVEGLDERIRKIIDRHLC